MDNNEKANKLEAFYHRIDILANTLSGIHKHHLKCQMGCHACCKDGLEIFGIEAEHIKENVKHAVTVHPEGKCAFLSSNGSCQIYDVRPYICRVFGLPLHWKEKIGSRQFESRSICDLNASVDVDAIPYKHIVPATLLEEELAFLQYDATSGKLEKISLRMLASKISQSSK